MGLYHYFILTASILVCACSGGGSTITSGSGTTDIGGSGGFGGGGGFYSDVTAPEPDAPAAPDVASEPDVTSAPDVVAVPDAVTGCVTGAPCNDGDLCTVNDQCTEAGVCSGTLIPCDDGAPCTLDSCAAGVCTSVVSPGSCFIEATCWSAAQPHPTDACKRCVPNESATSWSVTLGASCDDGDACTEADACSAFGCAGAPTLCDDDNPCTTDSCGAGGCAHAPSQGPCGLDDGNPCTEGTCDKGACVTVALTGPCNDSEPCTIGDACQDGACVPGPLKDKDQDGYADLACGGDDCNDGDKGAHPGAAEVCGDGVDNDCNGLTDADEEACSKCAYHTDCYPERLCGYWPTAGELRCSVPCASPANCGPGEICAHVPGSANLSYCRPSEFPSGGTNGAACTDGPQCGSEICADNYCVDTCANQLACIMPAHVCHPAGDMVEGFQAVCSPTAAFPAGYPNGAKCNGFGGNCQSGHCDLWGDDTCRPMCVTDDECSFAQQCNLVLRSSGPIAEAVPFDPQFTFKTYDAVMGCFNRTASGNQGIGTTCSVNGVCRSGKCLALIPNNPTMFCTGYCTTDADCPTNMKCKQEAITLASGFLQLSGQALPGGYSFVRVCKFK